MCMCPKNLNKSMLHLPIRLFLPSRVGSSHEQQEKGSEVASLTKSPFHMPCSVHLDCLLHLSHLGLVFLGSRVLRNLSGDLKNL
jgi:hypothetical protein